MANIDFEHLEDFRRSLALVYLDKKEPSSSCIKGIPARPSVPASRIGLGQPQLKKGAL